MKPYTADKHKSSEGNMCLRKKIKRTTNREECLRRRILYRRYLGTHFAFNSTRPINKPTFLRRNVISMEEDGFSESYIL
jgi:hypothetical protein